MTRPTYRAPLIDELRSYAGRRVSVRLDDASVHEGEFRTELLSDRSISVFLARGDHEGSTIYIHEIVGIEPIA